MTATSQHTRMTAMTMKRTVTAPTVASAPAYSDGGSGLA
jgi:hypothetical protein